MIDIPFDESWSGWRSAARRALNEGRAPGDVSWHRSGSSQQSLLGDLSPATSSGVATAPPSTNVPRAFIALGADVACHASPSRWAALYRVLWRLTHGEAHLLDVYVDEDVHALHVMAKAVRREGHKLRAFVRFRRVDEGSPSERYLAWFEPEHDVVAREAPFFARRFPAMCWAILTPSVSAHWDREALTYGPGAQRANAPTGDDLENLWRTYYAHTFNPARLKPRMMRSEMPVRYWKNLPEAELIAPLMRDAPARLRIMIEHQRVESQRRPTAALPAAAPQQVAALPGPQQVASLPGPPHDDGVQLAAQRSRRARALLSSRGVTSAQSPLAHGEVRVGTASWTDPTMTARGVFYPDGVNSSEARLRHYASQFSLVEVDATYYAMPSERNARLWAERTPDGFVFDIKAHALMTGHTTSLSRLPSDLRDSLPRHLRAARDLRRATCQPSCSPRCGAGFSRRSLHFATPASLAPSCSSCRAIAWRPMRTSE